jgi:uroporphyrinogen-III synthase
MKRERILYLGLDPSHYSSTTAEITHYPIIEISPRPLEDSLIQQAFLQFAQYSHVIFTSKSSVKIICDYAVQMGFLPSIWEEKKIISVGRVTANHLSLRNISSHFIAKEETAEGIIELLQEISLENAFVFWPHSSQARPLIRDFLNNHSILHIACPIYDPKISSFATLIQLEEFNEIVFTSPSTVDAFLRLFNQFPIHAKLTTIGPITARYLRDCMENR